MKATLLLLALLTLISCENRGRTHPPSEVTDMIYLGEAELDSRDSLLSSEIVLCTDCPPSAIDKRDFILIDAWYINPETGNTVGVTDDYNKLVIKL